jgi:hypothetical protein
MLEVLLLATLATGIVAAFIVATLPPIRTSRRGALRFVRIGRLQFSFVVCKRSI